MASGFQMSMRVWMPKATSREASAVEQRLLGQEDLVDEVEVGDALRDQAVDLGQQEVEVAAAVLVAEVELGAEGAGVGAAAGGLDLGAGAARRRVEAVVVVGMARDEAVGPCERGMVGEAAGPGAAVGAERAAVAPGGAADRGGLARVGELGDRLLGLAAQHDVGAELGERGAGRRRAVRADRDGSTAAAGQRAQEGRGHAQLGRRAAPEEVGGRGGHHRHVGAKAATASGSAAPRASPSWPSKIAASWPRARSMAAA
jgi:hypothetical protein